MFLRNTHTHTLPTDSCVDRLPSSSTGVGTRERVQIQSAERSCSMFFAEAVIIALPRLQIVNSGQKSRFFFKEA